MDREQWAERLAELVRPGAPTGAKNRLMRMLAAIDNEPAWIFSEDSLTFVAGRCSSTPNFARFKQLLGEFRRTRVDTGPPSDAPFGDERESEQDRDRRLWDQRSEWLRRDWDDPARIRERIAMCAGELRFLRLLAGIVSKWAPQHLGLLPPSAIAAFEQDGMIATSRTADSPPPPTSYFTPEQLAQAGIRRDGIPSATTTEPLGPDPDATDDGRYPARDDVDLGLDDPNY